jgi:hypothetical protein
MFNVWRVVSFIFPNTIMYNIYLKNYDVIQIVITYK